MVAILFTDLVGSTELLARLGDDAADDLRRAHVSLLREAIAESGGQEVKTTGDGVMAVFASSVDALGCAVTIQRAVHRANQEQPDDAVAVRVGLNVGEPVRDEDDYHGMAVNVAARLCGQAQGGQILASELLVMLVGSRGGFRIRPVGQLPLKGVPEPVAAVSVEWRDGQTSAAASKTEEPTERAAPPPARPVVRPVAARGLRLVGRDAELAVLEAELSRAVDGEFRCLLVLADPGVGKTRLSAELIALHPEALALLARAHPLGGTASFGLWAEALDGHLRRVTATEVSVLCGGLLDDLAALLRSVAAARGSAPDREPSRSSLLEALAVLLANLAERQPVVVVFDDVHWADASSWDALQYLADNIPRSPVLVVALARPAELAEQQRATEVVLGLEQDEILARLPVRPFERAGTAALAEAVIGRVPPDALVDWVAERALGNPLFALGLLRALLAEGADLAAPQLRSLPEGLADRVMARVKRLDDSARETLELLALLGCRVELHLLSAVTGEEVDELGRTLDVLVRARLAGEEDRGPEVAYEVAHPLIAETIVTGVGAARRRALHRRAAKALLAAGRLGEAAPHFSRAGDLGDPVAVEALTGALRQAEDRAAFREALMLITSLAELLPAGDPRWLGVADALAWPAEWVVDHRADVHGVAAVPALRTMDAVMERHPEATRRATVKFRLASFLNWSTGDLAEGERHGRAALELFQTAGDTHGSLQAANELAWVRGLGGDYEALERGAAQVAIEARRAVDPGVELQAIMGQSFGALWQGHLGAARSRTEGALLLARQTGNAYRVPYTLALLAFIAALEGRVEEASPLLAEAKAPGFPYHEGLIVEWESWIHWLKGDFGASAQSLLEAVSWHPEGLSRRRAHNLGPGVAALTELGRLGEARSMTETLRAIGGDQRFTYLVEYSHWLDGFVAYREGDLAKGLDAMRQAVPGLCETNAHWQAALVLVDLAEVAADVGAVDAAAEAAARLAACAAALDRDLYRALAAIAGAWAQVARGDVDAAAVTARDAVEALRPLGYRAFLGRALAVFARASRGADPGGAFDAAREAALLFDRCGASWRRDRVLRLLDPQGDRYA